MHCMYIVGCYTCCIMLKVNERQQAERQTEMERKESVREAKRDIHKETWPAHCLGSDFIISCQPPAALLNTTVVVFFCNSSQSLCAMLVNMVAYVLHLS